MSENKHDFPDTEDTAKNQKEKKHFNKKLRENAGMEGKLDSNKGWVKGI